MWKKSNLKSLIFEVITITFVLFIFSNSVKTGTASTQMSDPITNDFYSIFTKLGLPITANTVSLIIRKLAHFIQFFVYSILLSFSIYYKAKKFSDYTFMILFIGLATGVVDEFLQTFVVGRSGDVRDVLIDFSGFLVAFLVFGMLEKNSNTKTSSQKGKGKKLCKE